MRNFQKKERFKRLMQSKPFLIFLGIVILVFIFSTFSFMSKMEETIKNRKIEEAKIAELEKSKEKLNSDISKLKTEAGVEIIRENYGVAKEGENMIMITDDKNSPATQPKADEGGFWSIIKSWFK